MHFKYVFIHVGVVDKAGWLLRFNATDMLERLRGKRVIIVGDSLNRNQWESLACLLYSAVPPSRAYIETQSSVYKVFRAKARDQFHLVLACFLFFSPINSSSMNIAITLAGALALCGPMKPIF